MTGVQTCALPISVVEMRGIVDAVFVEDECVGERTDLEQPVPVSRVACQSRHLESQHDAGASHADLGDEFLKTLTDEYQAFFCVLQSQVKRRPQANASLPARQDHATGIKKIAAEFIPLFGAGQVEGDHQTASSNMGYMLEMLGEMDQSIQQYLAHARRVFHQIFLFDEPTRGIDPLHASELRAFVADELLAGRTAIVATHDLQEVAELCERVVALAAGEVRGVGRRGGRVIST